MDVLNTEVKEILRRIQDNNQKRYGASLAIDSMHKMLDELQKEWHALHAHLVELQEAEKKHG